MMKREYYIYWYYLDGENSYLIWFSNDCDGVFTDEKGFVLKFEDIVDLQTFAKKNQITVDVEDPILLNLDVIQNWLKNGGSKINDYNSFLNAWNLLDDISTSTNGNFNSDRKLTKKIYEKIFWGCNLPAITPEGKSYEPNWTKQEIKIIQDTLNSGLKMFRKMVLKHNDEES